MNRIIAVTMAAAAVLTLTGGPANAASPNCVSAGERIRVRGTHMTMGQVHAVFDFTGTRVADHWSGDLNESVRRYYNCGGGHLGVMYRRHTYWNDDVTEQYVTKWRRAYNIPPDGDWQWADGS